MHDGRKSFSDYLLAAEALAYLAAAGLAVRYLPFRRIANWMASPGGGGQPSIAAGRIALAVERASRRAPWRTVCIHEGISAHRMLARRGFPSQFVYGLQQSPDALAAHVWVRIGADVIVGQAGIDGTTEIWAVPQTTG